MIQIEKDVPLIRARRKACKYPFADMVVGDSFFVANTTAATINVATYRAAKIYGFRFAVRTVDGGVRVWRVE